MEFAEVLRRRRMIRHYSDKALDPDVIERVLANALRAPSGGFSQGWAFLALTEKADRERFWPFVPTRVEHTPTMQDAPLVVVPLAHKAAYLDRYAKPDKGWEDRSESHWPAPYWFIDTGMAALLMLLTAVDEGLGACLWDHARAAGRVPRRVWGSTGVRPHWRSYRWIPSRRRPASGPTDRGASTANERCHSQGSLGEQDMTCSRPMPGWSQWS